MRTTWRPPDPENHPLSRYQSNLRQRSTTSPTNKRHRWKLLSKRSRRQCWLDRSRRWRWPRPRPRRYRCGALPVPISSSTASSSSTATDCPAIREPQVASTIFATTRKTWWPICEAWGISWWNRMFKWDEAALMLPFGLLDTGPRHFALDFTRSCQSFCLVLYLLSEWGKSLSFLSICVSWIFYV